MMHTALSNFFATALTTLITRLLHYTILQVAGYELHRVYGKQFLKLLLIIKTEVLPRLEAKSVVPHLLDAYLDEVSLNGERPKLPTGRARLEEYRLWGTDIEPA